MKKIVYIAFVFAGLIFASCQKENIEPTSSDLQVPQWDSTSENQRGASGDDAVKRGGDDDTGEPTGSGSDHGAPTDGEITDPNADPDEN